MPWSSKWPGWTKNLETEQKGISLRWTISPPPVHMYTYTYSYHFMRLPPVDMFTCAYFYHLIYTIDFNFFMDFNLICRHYSLLSNRLILFVAT